MRFTGAAVPYRAWGAGNTRLFAVCLADVIVSRLRVQFLQNRMLGKVYVAVAVAAPLNYYLG